MSQRLAELQRQRALLQDHLAWLDREIAAELARARGAGSGAAATVHASPREISTPAAATTRLTSTTAPDATLASAADETFATSVNLAPAAATSAAKPARDPEAILDQYRVGPDSLRKDIRKGCFLYFALAFLLLGIGVGALYLMFRL